MLRKFVVFALTFSIAFAILTISIFKVAQIHYVLSQSPSPTPSFNIKNVFVEYTLPYPGKITPDNFLWPIKALRDRIWLTFTFDPIKKADLYVLMADKRLQNAQDLFENGKADLGLSVMTKAEKYLESANIEMAAAKSQGMDIKESMQNYAMATLMHRKVLDEILAIAPEDARPIIVKNEDYPKRLFEEAKNNLVLLGSTSPVNPFGQN